MTTSVINGEQPQQVQVCCGNCAAYVPLKDTGGQGGECHFNPPSVITINKPDVIMGQMKQTINTVFAPVPITSWCMHFTPPRVVTPAVSTEVSVSEGQEKH